MFRTRSATAANPAGSVTAERSARLYRIVALLDAGPKTRDQLLRRLNLDVRSFYRDLEKLRRLAVAVVLAEHHYRLEESLDSALSHLPFPDPQLNVHEAIALAKGRTRAHRKLKQQLELITRPRMH